MAFVNEYISDEDISKYEIGKINKRYLCNDTHWTVDKGRGIYLRCVARGREEFRHQSTWTLYWHGELLIVYLDSLEAGGERGGPCWSRKKVRGLFLPPMLESKRHEILEDFKEALIAYKDGGVFATATQYTLTLDV